MEIPKEIFKRLDEVITNSGLMNTHSSVQTIAVVNVFYLFLLFHSVAKYGKASSNK